MAGPRIPKYDCICEWCGESFKAKHSTKRFCSRRCMDQSWHARKAPTHTCKHCGRLFAPKGVDRTTYCSRGCAFKDQSVWHGNKLHVCWLPKYSRVRPCGWCGRLHGNVRRLCCSDACRKSLSQRRSREKAEQRHKPKTVQCRQCKEIFITEYGSPRSVYCSKACARASREPGNMRRRARNHGVVYEYVNPIKVFERDGWRCQICGKQTPSKNRGTRRSNAPELDHRIPMANGGPHSYSNVQCACHACNVTKSNRSEVGQYSLRLVVE